MNVWPRSCWTHSPDWGAHRRMTRSSPQLNSVLSSRERAKARTAPAWPCSCPTCASASGCHTWMMPSSPPAYSVPPSRLSARHHRPGSLRPDATLGDITRAHLAMDALVPVHMRMVPSSPALYRGASWVWGAWRGETDAEKSRRGVASPLTGPLWPRSTRVLAPCHTRTRPLSVPANNSSQSALCVSARIAPPSPGNAYNSSPSVALHARTLPSQLPLKTTVPSEETLSARTVSEWPRSVRRSTGGADTGAQMERCIRPPDPDTRPASSVTPHGAAAGGDGAAPHEKLGWRRGTRSADLQTRRC